MKHFKKLKKAFGLNEYGMVDFPKKYSSVQISRIYNSDKMGGCSWCFPHGIDTSNYKYYKFSRNWKKYRKTECKPILKKFDADENINDEEKLDLGLLMLMKQSDRTVSVSEEDIFKILNGLINSKV